MLNTNIPSSDDSKESESSASLEQQLAEERKFSKEKAEELEKSKKKLARAERENESLNDKLSFISSVVEAKPEPNSGLAEFKELLEKDYQEYAKKNGSPTEETQALKKLMDVQSQLELLTIDSQILGKKIVAIAGMFSSGKSSFMNSFFSQNEVVLPVGTVRTTAIASYVMHGENTEITAYSYSGGKVQIPENVFSIFTHASQRGSKFNMKRIIADISFKTEFVHPYENICFVDTPGFDAGNKANQDYETAVAAIAGAQVLLYCFNVNNGTIQQNELSFLGKVLKSNPNIKIYIIANQADKKPLETYREILSDVKAALESDGIEYEGMSLYISKGKKFGAQPEEFSDLTVGKSLAEFLNENNTPDRRQEEELLKQVRDVFKAYVWADNSRLNQAHERIQALNFIDSTFMVVVGRKDEAIHKSGGKSTRSYKSNKDTDERMGAVLDRISQMKKECQDTLDNVNADRVAAEELYRKFSKCIMRTFGDTGMQALESLTSAEEADDKDSQYNVGEQYYFGSELEQNYAEAAKWYLKAASNGSADAEYRLGYMYANGQGVDQNQSQSMEWYRKAAEHGNAIAQSELGSLYYNGRGVIQNFAEAFKWYSEAAAKGQQLAQYWLGVMYEYGQGTQQDFKKSLAWYRKAGDAGFVEAQNCIGRMYYMGQGIKQDFAEAMIWYRTAAFQGNMYAQYNLAIMYLHGEGTEQNLAEALKWFQKSADNGYKEAQARIGDIYMSGGQGLRRNWGLAWKCYWRADAYGRIIVVLLLPILLPILAVLFWLKRICTENSR